MSEARSDAILRYASRGSAWACTALLAVLVAWAPLPFASVEPLWEALLRAATAAALLLGLPVLTASRALGSVAVPAAALAAVAAFGLVQSLPLPLSVASAVSPRHAETYAAAADVLPPGGGPAPSGRARLTLSPESSRSAALGWASAAAALLAAAFAGRSCRRRRWLAWAVLAAAGFQLLYGARHYLAEARTIWGRPVIGVGDRLRGTFVNPNDLAYLFEIALAVAFAWGWWGVRRGVRERSVERVLLLGAGPLALWIALFVGVVFTKSRAGLLAVGAGTLLQAALLALAGRRWSLIAWSVGLLGVGAAGATALSATPAFERLFATSVYEVALGARSRVASLGLALWSEFPWTGTGLGTFRDAFMTIRPPDFAADTWNHAHNDYVELLVTVGVVGAGAIGCGLAALCARLLRVLRDGRRSEDRAAGLAALGALGAVGVHEAFDFGLAIPAIFVTLAVVCGASAAARVAAPRRQRGSRHRVRSGQRPHLDEVRPRSQVDVDA